MSRVRNKTVHGASDRTRESLSDPRPVRKRAPWVIFPPWKVPHCSPKTTQAHMLEHRPFSLMPLALDIAPQALDIATRTAPSTNQSYDPCRMPPGSELPWLDFVLGTNQLGHIRGIKHLHSLGSLV